MSNHQPDDDFNPTGTVWIMILFFFMIIAFWGYAYVEMLLRN